MVGLPGWAGIKTHFWTLITYGWFVYPGRFWELFTNMLWVYLFGSVVQFLVGFRQVIPLYIYGIVSGGIFFLLGLLLPGIAIPANMVQLGPGAGVITLAAASVTIAPTYRVYFSEYFSISLWIIAAVFGALIIVSTGFYPPALLLLSGGAFSGFVYIRALQSGYRPGAWMYQVTSFIEGLVTPGGKRNRNGTRGQRLEFPATTHRNTPDLQAQVDEILDKINQKGLGSLTDNERDILKKAGKN
jgi:hypothetical protein